MRTDRSDHLQGEGTYTYQCRKKDCWYCEYFGLTPFPEIIEVANEERFIARTFKKKKYRKNLLIKHWTKEEDKLIVENIWMTRGEMVKILKGRTMAAISQRKTKLISK